MINSFNCCVSENVHLSSFSKDILAGYRIQGWQFLSSSTAGPQISFCSMSFHCNVHAMPQEFNSCLYELADGKIGFIMFLQCSFKNLPMTLSGDLHYFKALFHYLLVCIISDWKYADIFIFVPLHLRSLFLWLLLRIFYLSVNSDNLIMLLLDVIFFMFLGLGVSWVPWMCGIIGRIIALHQCLHFNSWNLLC